MSSDLKKKSKYHDKIVTALESYSETYDFKAISTIVDTIHNGINKVTDHKKVRKIICNYAHTTNNKITFNTESESGTSYKTLRAQFKNKVIESESDVESDTEVKPVKKMGGFMKIMKDDYSDNTIKKQKPKQEQLQLYEYPIQKSYKYVNHNFEPQGSQWTYDPVQTNDISNKRIYDIVDKLLQIEFPAQRSDGWFLLRNGAITASDGGCVTGNNSYEQPYKFIVKKLGRAPFVNNQFCYHGKKYEQIATMIYQNRMNATVEEFGLIVHPKYSYLAASPDGIVGKYKVDGKHTTNLTGRMLEIKCPVSRKILTDGPIKNGICPIYYWVQVQLQLECCDLDDCDFWQCEISEYEDKEEFIDDTNVDEPWLSISSGFEKGCVIQLLPKKVYSKFVSDNDNIDIKQYYEIVYEHAQFIYPPRIDMTPFELDVWVNDTIQQIHIEHRSYCLDKIIWWKLVKSHNVTIKRDKEWFKESLPIFTKMWNYVLFFRENKDKEDLFFEYIESCKIKRNDKIMEIVDIICNLPDDNNSKAVNNYAKQIIKIKNEIKSNTLKNKTD